MNKMHSTNASIRVRPYLQRQVGVFLFLAHLQTRQVGVLELQVVLLSEVLRHGAFDCLTVLKLQWKSVGLKKRLSGLFHLTAAVIAGY